MRVWLRIVDWEGQRQSGTLISQSAKIVSRSARLTGSVDFVVVVLSKRLFAVLDCEKGQHEYAHINFW